MNVDERKKLRDDLLEEIYNAYHSSSDSELKASIDIKDNINEKKIALRYLQDKEYITKFYYDMYGKTTVERITAKGIDYIESVLLESKQ